MDDKKKISQETVAANIGISTEQILKDISDTAADIVVYHKKYDTYAAELQNETSPVKRLIHGFHMSTQEIHIKEASELVDFLTELFVARQEGGEDGMEND